MQNLVSSLFRSFDRVTVDLWRSITGAARSWRERAVSRELLWLVLGVTFVKVVLDEVFGRLNRAAAFVERGLVLVAMLTMTFLAFNDYLTREAVVLFEADGQMNIALLLMVVVGFFGASLATFENKHIAVDAVDRVLSPPSARFVKRFTSLVAAGLCWMFVSASQEAVLNHSHDSFEGAKVWSPLVGPVNLAVALVGTATPVDSDADGLADHKEIWKVGTDPFAADSDGDGLDDKAELYGPDGAPDTFDEGDPLNAPDATEKREFKRPPGKMELQFDTGWLQALLLLPSGDRFGEGTPHASQEEWENAQFEAGLEFDELPPAFVWVKAGDRFPLWIPLQVIVYAFALMALRFLGQAIYPPSSVPMGLEEPVAGTRKPVDVVFAGGFPGALVALGLGAYFGSGALILVGSILLVLLGSPLFVAVGVGTMASWVLLRENSASVVISDVFEATKKQELLAIPFFVLAGNLMTRGSIARRLIEFTKTVLGPVPGGLGAGAVVACAIFAAISGSSPVTVIAIGSILYPMLVAEGYDDRYSMGVLTTAGGLGIIIPPSIPMIVYAIVVSRNPNALTMALPDGTTETVSLDPAALFKAGILPGLFIALVLIVYTFFVTWPRTEAGLAAHRASQPTDQGAWAARTARSFVRSVPSLALPVLILGGIYGWLDLSGFGIPFALRFTVTEAAAVAVVYALFVELVVNRELKLKDVPDVVSESAIMMGSLFLILVIAISLNRFFVFEQVPDAATQWMLARVSTPTGFLVMVNLFLLALGCVMDILSAILIVAPLLAPIAASYGIHPVHFGIMFIVNLELGYLTPPMGINLFVASTVFERSIVDVIRAIVPFLFLMLFCLAVIVWVPWLSLALLD
ncbi:MAG: TRAP transporter large permease subunit [Myxococcota bacterium]